MKNNLRVVIGQINVTVGDVTGNTEKIIKNIIIAHDIFRADIIVFPEMALTGYLIKDILFNNDLHIKIKKALKKIFHVRKKIYVILGVPIKEKYCYFNSALVIYNGSIIHHYCKTRLVKNKGIDETNYFDTKSENNECFFTIKNILIIISISEDLYDLNKSLKKLKKDDKNVLIINISSFPFPYLEKLTSLDMDMKYLYRIKNFPIINVNNIGLQEEIIFYGKSFLYYSSKVLKEVPLFTECLVPLDFYILNDKLIPKINYLKNFNTKDFNISIIYDALVVGLRDYIEKNGFVNVIIGISGGIDSALTLAIAVDALGIERVKVFYLPSRHSSKLSNNLVNILSKNLGIKYSIISIEPIFKLFLKIFKNNFKNPNTIQNIQARCRGIILMSLANEQQAIVLSTGNKSEIEVGYATLYGDMVGGLSILKDVSKTIVYKLAKYRNKISKIIPKAIIVREPTAELLYNQKDSDDLPKYAILDKIMMSYIEQQNNHNLINKLNINKKIIDKITNMFLFNEYKRRQSPPGIKITSCMLGIDKKYPMISKY